MAVTHLFVSGIADGADATLVQPGDWNDSHVFPDKNVFLTAPGSVTLATTAQFRQPNRLTLASADRLSAAGTGRATLTDAAQDPSVLRLRNPGSVTLMPDEFVLEYQRVAFYGDSRKTMVGNARVVLTDLVAGSRLALTGRG